MKNLLLTVFYILFVNLILAQVPQAMSYQSVIRDSSGDLVSETAVGIQISVLQASAEGTAVYVEVHAPMTNANGLASMEIGNGTPITGTFTAIDWASGPYFLKSEVDPSGGTNYSLSITSELLSVPYALHAETSADNHWSENGSGINTSNYHVGINSSNPQHTLDVRSPSQTEPAALNVSNDDRSRYVRFFSGSETYPDPSMSWAPGHDLLMATFDDSSLVFDEKMRISQSGDVGIGVVDPEARLDIRGGDWNLDAGNPGDLRIGNATNNFRIGIATGGGGAGITRMYTNSNALILGANDSPSLILESNGEITSPSITNSLIETAGNKSLVTKEYVDNAIATSTETKTIAYPSSHFRPGTLSERYRSLPNRSYFWNPTGDFTYLEAPILLPEGSVITEIKVHVRDLDAVNNLQVNHIEGNIGGTSSTFYGETTSGSSGHQILTPMLNSSELLLGDIITVVIQASTGDSWLNEDLAVLGMSVTYIEN